MHGISNIEFSSVVCMYVYVYVPCIRACMRERVSVIQFKLTNNSASVVYD
jgi:hypothetical protein